MAAGVPQVEDYMARRVITVDISDSVYDAAEAMIKNDVGCVVVTNQDKIAGVITKGDIIKKSVLELKDPSKTTAGSIMSNPFIKIGPEASLEDAAKLMSEKEVSKLPVINADGLLVGIITANDIIKVGPLYVDYLRGLIESKSSRVTHS